MIPNLLLVACSLVAPAVALQADYQPLGALPGGSIDSVGLAISADGSVIVGCSDSAEGVQAFRYTAETGIEGLGLLPGAVSSSAIDVSANGKIIAGTAGFPDGTSRAFRWTEADGMVDIGSLTGSQSATATAISPDGTAIVGGSGNEAFLWTESGGIQGLGNLPGGGFFSLALDVSSQGESVVGASFSDLQGDETREAFRWTAATGIRGLGLTDAGLVAADATVVTPDGSQIFGFSTVIITLGTLDVPLNIPFRWTVATGAVEFGTGAAGFRSATPTSASSDGELVAFSKFTTVGNLTERAGVLLPGMTRIRSLFNELNQGGAPNLSDTLLISAAVSLDGRAFTGDSMVSGAFFETQAWLGSLLPLEPASVGTVFCAPQVPNSTGVAASLEGIGSTETDLNFLRLGAAGMPAGQFGYFLASQTQGFVQQPGGSQGTLCLGGAIARFSADIFAVDASGAAEQTLDLASIPAPTGAVPVAAGETYSFQAWFRDVNPMPTSNFTTGLAVMFE